MEQVGLMKLQQLETASITAAPLEPQPTKYIVSPGLFRVLKAEGAQGELFTKKEIMNYLRSYICNRVLFDIDNPTLIHCENDPLGDALGVKQFNVEEALALLSANVRLAAPPQKGHGLPPGYPRLCNTNVGEKRKSSDLEDEPSSLKRHCSELLDGRTAPTTRDPPSWYFHIYDAPDYDSSPETSLSCQGYETAVAVDSKESSDDLWVFETDEEYEVEIEGDDNFEVEYEVNSLANSSAVDDTDSESDVALQEMIGAEAILVCKNDSDVEFWADSDTDGAIVDEQSTSESDPEISDGDKWKCTSCAAFNRPLLRFCQKCWRLRNDWLPDLRPQKRLPLRKNARRRRHADLMRTASWPSDHGRHNNARAIGEVDRQLHRTARHRRTSRSMIDVSIIEELHNSVSEDGSSAITTSATPKIEETFLGIKVERNEEEEGSTTAGTSDLGAPPPVATAADHPPSPDRTSAAAVVVSNPASSSTTTTTSLCSICLSKPKNASIVHGKIGHQICCYACGKKLWARNKPCPICRRTIQKLSTFEWHDQSNSRKTGNFYYR